MVTASETEPKAPGPKSDPASPGNWRILIVDDAEAIHEDFRKILCGVEPLQLDESEIALFGEKTSPSRRGTFTVDSAHQGEEGLALVEQACAQGRPYAVAFVDVRMPPGWDGVETTLRIWEVDPALQVVICTAYSDYFWDDMIEKLGRSDRLVILKKPFDPVEVLQLANALTEKWCLQQAAKVAVQHLNATVAERTAQLCESQDLLTTLLENTPDGIYFKDLQSRFVRCSDCFKTLFQVPGLDLIIGRSDFDFFTREHAQPAYDDEQEIIRTGKPMLCKREQETHADGRVTWALTSKMPWRNKDGKIIGTFGISKDITDMKEAETERQAMEVQLRQAQKLEAIGQLAAGIAHEINTPTQYVGDNTRFLQDSFRDLRKVLKSHQELLSALQANRLTPELTSRAREVVAAADLDYLFEQTPAAITQTLEGVERITKIVRAMKEFSHPGGKEKTPADLNHAIDTTVTVARNEWKYVAEMELDLEPLLPPVPCFLGEFNQAILNLVVNAAHAIADVQKKNPTGKGKITIRTRRSGDQVEVRVSDTGTGIPESARPHIFEPFFTTKPVGKGTGQGLSIVYGCVVKHHGGTVAFESEVGKGTTFILRLPIASAPAAPHNSPSHDQAPLAPVVTS